MLDVAFALLAVSTIAYFVRETRNFSFRTDDWALAFRGGSFGDYFEPYNDHLAIVHISIYKALYEIWGFGTYLPLRAIAIGTIAAIAVGMYLLFRARVGAAIALVAGTSLLWYPQLQLSVPNFPLFLPVVAAIACAWILPKPRPAHDVALGLVLTLALCTSGTGASAAAGCLVYLAFTRPRLWRWVAVIVPTAAWALWWLTATETSSRQRPVTEVADPILTGIRDSFAGLAFGNVGLGTVLALAFVALLAWRLRRGPSACANELAWSAALVFWWAGLAISRTGSLDSTFRYEFVGSAFVLLACLPTKSTNLPARLDWRALAVASILAAAVIVVVNKPGIDDTTLVFTYDNRLIRQALIAANQGPEVVPDQVPIYIGAFQPVTAAEYRSAVARYGDTGRNGPAEPRRRARPHRAPPPEGRDGPAPADAVRAAHSTGHGARECEPDAPRGRRGRGRRGAAILAGTHRDRPDRGRRGRDTLPSRSGRADGLDHRRARRMHRLRDDDPGAAPQPPTPA